MRLAHVGPRHVRDVGQCARLLARHCNGLVHELVAVLLALHGDFERDGPVVAIGANGFDVSWTSFQFST